MIGTRQGYPRWHTASAQGPRSNNADAVGAYAVAGGPGIVFALADGVGDDPAAAHAARIAAAAAARTAVHKGPVAAIMAAQEAVRAQSSGDAVLVVAMPFEGGYRIAWVGDTRAYSWDGMALRRHTTDHTLAEYFRARHQPTTPSMEHMVTTSVRTTKQQEIGTVEVACTGLLLTSDGVHKTLNANEIREILLLSGGGAAGLVETAISHGGSDNATALFVEPLEVDSTTVRFPVAA